MYSCVFEFKDVVTTPNLTEAPDKLWEDCKADYYEIIEDKSSAKNYFGNYDASSNTVTITYDEVVEYCENIKHRALSKYNAIIERISDSQIATFVSSATEAMINSVPSEYSDNRGGWVIYDGEYFTIDKFYIMLMREYIVTGDKQSHTFYIGSVWNFHI